MVIDPRHLAKLIDKLPAFPESVSKILQLTADKELASRELVAVVERDMVMTVRVLKLVHSKKFRVSLYINYLMPMKFLKKQEMRKN